MRRRTLLLAAGAAVGLPGCGGGDSEPPGADEELTDEDHFLLFRAAADAEVEDVHRDGEVIALEYVIGTAAQDEREREVQSLAREYASRVADGLEADRMEATGIENGIPALDWHVETEWVRAFNDGDMTIEEFHAAVLDTVEEV